MAKKNETATETTTELTAEQKMARLKELNAAKAKANAEAKALREELNEGKDIRIQRRKLLAKIRTLYIAKRKIALKAFPTGFAVIVNSTGPEVAEVAGTLETAFDDITELLSHLKRMREDETYLPDLSTFEQDEEDEEPAAPVVPYTEVKPKKKPASNKNAK